MKDILATQMTFIRYAPRIHDIEAKYYADSEDAFDMRKAFKPVETGKKGKAGASGAATKPPGRRRVLPQLPVLKHMELP